VETDFRHLRGVKGGEGGLGWEGGGRRGDDLLYANCIRTKGPVMPVRVQKIANKEEQRADSGEQRHICSMLLSFDCFLDVFNVLVGGRGRGRGGGWDIFTQKRREQEDEIAEETLLYGGSIV
jgi:hypothetical protein